MSGSQPLVTTESRFSGHDFSAINVFSTNTAGNSKSRGFGRLADPSSVESPNAEAKDSSAAQPTSGGNDQCFVTGHFTAIPSGNVEPVFDGTKFHAPEFKMSANFTPLRAGCDCHCGEYRQFVRGTMTNSGHPGWVLNMCGNKKLDPDVLQEDCIEEDTPPFRYGHRADGFNHFFDDKMKYDRNGCTFHATDSPGLGLIKSGERLDVKLFFYAALVDVCAGGKVLQEASWRVVGSGVAP